MASFSLLLSAVELRLLAAVGLVLLKPSHGPAQYLGISLRRMRLEWMLGFALAVLAVLFTCVAAAAFRAPTTVVRSDWFGYSLDALLPAVITLAVWASMCNASRRTAECMTVLDWLRGFAGLALRIVVTTLLVSLPYAMTMSVSA
jgi:hypothetical protein